MPKREKPTSEAIPGASPPESGRRMAEILERRNIANRELGAALAASTAASGPFTSRRPIIEVAPGDQVWVRMVKAGVIYSFALNLTPLPHNDRHVYRLLLQAPMNGLVWTVYPTKPEWAYQVDLAINGQVFLLDRAQWQLGAPLPEPQQQIIRVTA